MHYIYKYFIQYLSYKDNIIYCFFDNYFNQNTLNLQYLKNCYKMNKKYN